jgi:peptide deformylase
MSIKKTVQIGVGVLRKKALAVKDVSAEDVQETIKDLIDSMRHNNLVGMAAPQIGRGYRIFVSEIRKTAYRKNVGKNDSLKVFINPRITWRSKRQTDGYEGCGSVVSAQIFGKVKRPASVVCVALDEKGRSFTIKASGLLARVIQHEIDHLDGIVFIDKVSNTRTLLDDQSYVNLKRK